MVFTTWEGKSGSHPSLPVRPVLFTDKFIFGADSLIPCGAISEKKGRIIGFSSLFRFPDVRPGRLYETPTGAQKSFGNATYPRHTHGRSPKIPKIIQKTAFPVPWTSPPEIHTILNARTPKKTATREPKPSSQPNPKIIPHLRRMFTSVCNSALFKPEPSLTTFNSPFPKTRSISPPAHFQAATHLYQKPQSMERETQRCPLRIPSSFFWGNPGRRVSSQQLISSAD